MPSASEAVKAATEFLVEMPGRAKPAPAKPAPAPAKPAPILVTDGSIPGTSSRRIEATPKRRLIISVEGHEKCGKSHFAMTAPGPIAIQNIDVGLEGVAEKFVSDKELHVAEYRLEVPYKQDAAQAVWSQFINDYKAFLASGRIRTIIWDTATEVWEFLRLARLGRLTQVMPVNYTQCNTEFREMVRMAFDSDVNLILLHKVKKQYINDQPTGKFERAGFSDAGFLVQVVTQAVRGSDGQFKLKVLDARQNADLKGRELSGAEVSFGKLANLVVPQFTEEEWNGN